MTKLPTGYNEACFAVGRIAIAWAYVERTLTGIVSHLHAAKGGHQIEPHIPRALGRKVSFLRSCLNRLDIADPEVRERGLELAKETSRLSDKRHWCVHAVIDNIVDRDLGDALQLRRFALDYRAEETVTITLKEIDSLAGDITVLSLNLFILAANLGAVDRDKAEQIFSKFTRQPI